MKVLAKKGSRSVYGVTCDSREWMTILCCVNAIGEAIPSYYIFKGSRITTNYIRFCEPGAAMAVQKKAWMTGELFQAWLKHFDDAISLQGKENRHLLVLDGHGSHVSLEVVAKAKESGIDIVTLPAHTSHKLEPLDVSVFKPLKVQFRKERDKWQQRTASKQASKTELASIVAIAISLSLTEANIKAGFRATGIWPLDFAAVKFEGMPCNHINLVEETSPLDETESQVPKTPIEQPIEDEVEAILALNTLASQLQKENRISSQQENRTHAISFTQLLEGAEISNYTPCDSEPHFFTKDECNWDITPNQITTNYMENQVSSPTLPVQPQRDQDARLSNENAAQVQRVQDA
ncbi:hypothetical protein GOP47_0002463 [Adiantum capillus-veneris]|uniref:DDE-1 domain-containing protein n=1 Tax=Adiantum capillus-veneris TaxID=13818 RepID=A0A9D4ZRN1_ADICA|nr:hypothetical protein GOP47_0002463 [Adiantum capillus-veneris]